MSISSAALFTPAKAASTTASGEPTNVTTVRLVASPGSTSSSLTPPEDSMADVIWRIIALSRPSLKLGTHSTIRFSIGNEVRFILSKIKKIREKYEKIVTKKATPDSETAVSGFFPQERRARSRKFPQGEKASGGSRGAGKRGGGERRGRFRKEQGNRKD